MRCVRGRTWPAATRFSTGWGSTARSWTLWTMLPRFVSNRNLTFDVSLFQSSPWTNKNRKSHLAESVTPQNLIFGVCFCEDQTNDLFVTTSLYPQECLSNCEDQTNDLFVTTSLYPNKKTFKDREEFCILGNMLIYSYNYTAYVMCFKKNPYFPVLFDDPAYMIFII
jgi:hypothetical protein